MEGFDIVKKIMVIATGGTIVGTGAVGKSKLYEAGQINIDEIIETIGDINEIAKVEAIQMFNVDSNDLTLDNWIELKNLINEVALREDINGIVITHGTDTLDETAFFLNLVCETSKPIVITGAMRPATATSPDGPMNLYQAIALASSDDAVGMGVVAVFSNTIYSSRDIQKENNFKTDAFSKKDFGCLGYMLDEKPYLFSKTFKRHTYTSEFPGWHIEKLPKVGISYFYVGAPADDLLLIARDKEGMVIVGSGTGNYSKEWIKAIEKLIEKGKVIVRASRVNNGMVFENIYFDPSNRCISANTLTGPKARVLLMLALSVTKNINEIKRIFGEY